MAYSFSATIYKIGINLVVDVPASITQQLRATKGYIPVKGVIENHPFEQTLCPVKGKEYLLYVNGLMLKGSGMKQGDTAHFSIEQNLEKRKDETFPEVLREKLIEQNLLSQFEALMPSRQKEIFRYIHYLKTEEALGRNLDKVIRMLQENGKPRIP